MSTAAPAVRAHRLAVAIPRIPWRPDLPVLHRVDLTAPAGRATVIVGANGCGKTTLLRALTGQLRPAAGSIRILGAELGPADAPLPPDAAIVPDQPAWPPSWDADQIAGVLKRQQAMRGRDAQAGRARGTDAAPDGDLHGAVAVAARSSTVPTPLDLALAGRILREHGVPLSRPIGRMSRGQQTWVSIAFAIAMRPRLIILDEPLARLDPLGREHVVDLLREHLAGGDDRSVLMTSHDLDGMDRFADHLVVMAHGRSILEGDVDDLLDDHVIAAFDERAAADGVRLLGPRRISGGGVEALVRVDDAVGLPPGADLRRPELTELITHMLREVES